MNFVNLTPHALTVEGLGTIAPSGLVARAQPTRTPATAIGGIRCIEQTLGAPTNIPPAHPGTVYIVSGLVLDACKRHSPRADVVAPDTGADAVRENGNVVAVRGFVC